MLMLFISRPVLLKTAEKRMFSDGLSSIEFQRQSLEFRQKYTRVLIKVDESEIMKVGEEV